MEDLSSYLLSLLDEGTWGKCWYASQKESCNQSPDDIGHVASGTERNEGLFLKSPMLFSMDVHAVHGPCQYCYFCVSVQLVTEAELTMFLILSTEYILEKAHKNTL